MSGNSTDQIQARNTVQRSEGWTLRQWYELPVDGFDCDDGDLNEYFSKDAIEARKLMVCETFAILHTDSGDTVLGLVSVCNDVVSVKALKDYLEEQETPAGKLSYKEWPAVKIARLAVRREIQGKNIGTHLVNLLKTLFVTENRTGCRIMTVDAYNRDGIPSFYERNGFEYLTGKDKNRQTRAMWFDLLPYRNALEKGS